MSVSRSARPRSSRFRFLLLAAAIYAVTVSGGVAFGLHMGKTHQAGLAAEITVDGKPSGIYRLSVGPAPLDEMSSSASVRPSGDQRATTPDQANSEATGWDAACVTWGRVGVVGPDQALACTTESFRPVIKYSSSTVGQSANLPNALAYLDWHHDIVGDLKVAATGEVWNLTVINPVTGESTVDSEVIDIAGVELKAAAAARAGVDLLIVPADQADEFAESSDVIAAGVEVIGVRNVGAALHELCARSRTEVCVERVLATE